MESEACPHSDKGCSMDPQAVIKVFRRNVTQHYFDMKGRVRRQEFWYFMLACVAIYVVAGILEAIIRLRILTPIIGLALLLPIAGLGARRLQDTGKNGGLIWAYTVASATLELISLLGVFGPYGMPGSPGSLYFLFRPISLIWLVVLVLYAYVWAQPGTTGPNEFGSDPNAASGPATPTV
jgi:uncharacterized membrane protein YhaH (DUF805 family)